MEKFQLLDIVTIALENLKANLHTAVIAKVAKVNDTTIDCKPVVSRNVKGKSIPLPTFIDVPPVFLQGGNTHTAHPIAVGDYALLLFNERCYDNWYYGQDFVLPIEYRTHDYSDAFAIVGINPLDKAIQIPADKITTMGNSIQTGNAEVVGNVTITGDLQVNGDITCTGRITTAQLTIGATDYVNHVHTDVATGVDNTGGVA